MSVLINSIQKYSVLQIDGNHLEAQKENALLQASDSKDEARLEEIFYGLISNVQAIARRQGIQNGAASDSHSMSSLFEDLRTLVETIPVNIESIEQLIDKLDSESRSELYKHLFCVISTNSDTKYTPTYYSIIEKLKLAIQRLALSKIRSNTPTQEEVQKAGGLIPYVDKHIIHNNPILILQNDNRPGAFASEIFDLGRPESSNGKQIGFLNSTAQTKDQTKQQAESFSSIANNSNVHVVYNPSNGANADLEKFKFAIAGIETDVVSNLKSVWQSFFASNPNGQFLQLVEGDATIHVKNALTLMPESVRQKIVVIAINPSILIQDGLAGKSIHITNPNTAAFVFTKDIHSLSEHNPSIVQVSTNSDQTKTIEKFIRMFMYDEANNLNSIKDGRLFKIATLLLMNKPDAAVRITKLLPEQIRKKIFWFCFVIAKENGLNVTAENYGERAFYGEIPGLTNEMRAMALFRSFNNRIFWTIDPRKHGLSYSLKQFVKNLNSHDQTCIFYHVFKIVSERNGDVSGNNFGKHAFLGEKGKNVSDEIRLEALLRHLGDSFFTNRPDSTQLIDDHLIENEIGELEKLPHSKIENSHLIKDGLLFKIVSLFFKNRSDDAILMVQSLPSEFRKKIFWFCYQVALENHLDVKTDNFGEKAFYGEIPEFTDELKAKALFKSFENPIFWSFNPSLKNLHSSLQNFVKSLGDYDSKCIFYHVHCIVKERNGDVSGDDFGKHAFFESNGKSVSDEVRMEAILRHLGDSFDIDQPANPSDPQLTTLYFPKVMQSKPEQIVTVRLSGGLGNQLFQIAAALSFGLDRNAIIQFPHSELDHTKISPVLRQVPRTPSINSKGFRTIDESFKKIDMLRLGSESMYLSGFYQSAWYFNHHREDVLRLFAASEDLEKSLKEKHSSFIEKNTIALHFRRGDYLNFKNQHGLPILYNLSEDIDYYKKGLETFGNLDNYHLVVFSDDPSYVKNLSIFKGRKNISFIEGQQAHEDFYTMSYCKNHIIGNSSFSWWSAYMCTNPDQRVVSPKKWFGPGAVDSNRDPKAWYQVPSYLPMRNWTVIE